MTARQTLVVGIIVLLVGLTAVSSYLLLSSRTKTENSEPQSNLSDAKGTIHVAEIPFISSETIQDTDTKHNLTLKATFPKIVLPKNPVEETRANDVLKFTAMQEIERFQTSIDEDPPGALVPKEIGNDIVIGYDTLFISSEIISFRYNVAAFSAGAAHPNSYTVLLNYSIPEHRAISIQGIFDPSKNWLGFLSSSTAERLLDDCIDCDENMRTMIAEGTTPTEEHFARVALKETQAEEKLRGIVVVFDPYQVAPYVRGPQEVFIPLSEIGDYLNPAIRSVLEAQ